MTIPESVQNNPKALNYWSRAAWEIRNTYNRLVHEFGVPKEDARFILPSATKTSLIMTANFREWRHIIQLRTDPASQWEIRDVASRIRDILIDEAPYVFGDLRDANKDRVG